MPLLQTEQVIVFKSMPKDLADLLKETFSDSPPSIVILPLSDIEKLTEQTLMQWLHGEEMIRLANFTHKKRHREWLGGRLCAKQALSIFLNQQKTQSCPLERHQYRVAATETGRPFFSQPENITFSMPKISISHSSAFAAAMVSQRHGGIDIQFSAENLLKVKEKFCTKKEEHVLHHSLPHLSPLLQLSLHWSGKEAIKKMLSPHGIPGFQELHLLKIKQQGQSSVIMYFTKDNEPENIFPVAAGIYNSNYALAVCCHHGYKT